MAEQPTQMTVKPPMIALRDHPRAAASIRRAKARAGLGGFAIGALGTWSAGGDPFTMALHGLAGGVAAYMVVWAIAVVVWRQLLLAEARTAVDEVVRQRRAAAQAARDRAAAAAAAAASS